MVGRVQSFGNRRDAENSPLRLQDRGDHPPIKQIPQPGLRPEPNQLTQRRGDAERNTIVLRFAPASLRLCVKHNSFFHKDLHRSIAIIWKCFELLRISSTDSKGSNRRNLRIRCSWLRLAVATGHLCLVAEVLWHQNAPPAQAIVQNKANLLE